MTVSWFARSLLPRRRCFVAVLGALLMAGCAVGPDFKRPAAPEVSDYTAHPVTTTVATENVAEIGRAHV